MIVIENDRSVKLLVSLIGQSRGWGSRQSEEDTAFQLVGPIAPSVFGLKRRWSPSRREMHTLRKQQLFLWLPLEIVGLVGHTSEEPWERKRRKNDGGSRRTLWFARTSHLGCLSFVVNVGHKSTQRFRSCLVWSHWNTQQTVYNKIIILRSSNSEAFN